MNPDETKKLEFARTFSFPEISRFFSEKTRKEEKYCILRTRNL